MHLRPLEPFLQLLLGLLHQLDRPGAMAVVVVRRLFELFLGSVCGGGDGGGVCAVTDVVRTTPARATAPSQAWCRIDALLVAQYSGGA